MLLDRWWLELLLLLMVLERYLTEALLSGRAAAAARTAVARTATSHRVCRRPATSVPWRQGFIARPLLPIRGLTLGAVPPEGGHAATAAAAAAAAAAAPPALPLPSTLGAVEVDALSAAQAEEELAHLAQAISYHDWLYYNSDGTSPDVIPDWKFDELERRQRAVEARFPDLARPDSRSLRVGAAPLGELTAQAGKSSTALRQPNGARERMGKRGPVGAPPPATPHLSPMMSLDNAMDEGELANYIGRVQRVLRASTTPAPGASTAAAVGGRFVSFVGEPKLDGLSLSLRYEDGVLVQAATRGDGRRGDDVTAAARHIPSFEVPLILRQGKWSRDTGSYFRPPKVFEVRGEVYMPTAALAPLNKLREACGLTPFANARNAASGSIRQQPDSRDHDEEDKSQLNDLALSSVQALCFQAYDVYVPIGARLGGRDDGQADGSWFSSHSDARSALQSWGFQIPECAALVELWVPAVGGIQASIAVPPPSGSCVAKEARPSSDDGEENCDTDAAAVVAAATAKAAKTMFACVEALEKRRSALGFDVDGVVFKVDAHDDRRLLGSTARAPRWAVAAKFAPRRAETVLQDIELSVGRTGSITPVAVLAPVEVGGAVVRRASLHNEGFVRALDLRPGDSVVVERAGDVIPQVVERIRQLPTPAAAGGDQLRGSPWSMPSACPACGAPVERRVLFTPTAPTKRKERKSKSPQSDEVDSEGRSENVSSYSGHGGGTNSAEAAAFRCTGGLHCPAQAVEALAHFVSRRAINLDGIGRAKLQELYDKGIVRTAPELLDLRNRGRQNAESSNDEVAAGKSAMGDVGGALLADLDGWGPTSARNLLEAIDHVRGTPLPLHRFIYSLGIEGVGFTTAELLAKEFGTFDTFWATARRLSSEEQGDQGDASAAAADDDDSDDDAKQRAMNTDGGIELEDGKRNDGQAAVLFDTIPGIGGVLVDSIRRFAGDARNVALINRLTQQLVVTPDDTPGLRPSERMLANVEGSDGSASEGLPMQGARVVFTGTLERCSREEAQLMARAAGAESTPASLTKRATHLVIGGAGKKGVGNKLRKAQELGTAVLKEVEFFELLEAKKNSEEMPLPEDQI